MKLFDFFYQESHTPKRKIIFMAILSGFANGVLLMLIHTAAESVSQSRTFQTQYFFLFLFNLMLYFSSKKYSLDLAIHVAEESISRVRIRVADKLRHTELAFIEKTGHEAIFNRMTQDTGLISESASVLVNASQQFIVVIICLLYIAWLSLTGWIITVAILGVTVLMYLYNSHHIGKKLHLAVDKESDFFNGIKQILQGFKEIKINRQKNDALFSHIKTISTEAKTLKLETGLHFVMELMFAQTSFYILCACVVFILPLLSPINETDLMGITIAILFLFSPLGMVVAALPMFVRANVSVENIYQLEKEIDQFRYENLKPSGQVPDFFNLKFKQISFSYAKQSAMSDSFTVGPLNFEIKKAEIVFIVGGNGSGKSTLLKLLTGLYYPSSGKLFLNKRRLNRHHYSHYRELYTALFTDFHLFDRLYGIPDIDEHHVQNLINMMGLETKTSFIQERFSHVDLSTGQRKRLAYISAMLEDKQIYIFDEWAADQDPEFREYFYHVLLKELKQQGKTVIAVSHDDRYFSVADKVIKMDYGQIVSIDVKP